MKEKSAGSGDVTQLNIVLHRSVIRNCLINKKMFEEKPMSQAKGRPFRHRCDCHP